MLTTWARSMGSTPEERARTWPAQELLPGPDLLLHRAVDVEAPAEVVFRWLCQLKVAPYSYDWVDNLGRRSPRTLTPGAEQLAVGQTVTTVFRIASFVQGESITLLLKGKGWMAVTYAAVPAGPGRSRLVVTLVTRRRRRPWTPATGALLAWGDAVMMRKQLLTLKARAEGR
ncbi:MAG: hypothetical protein ACXVFV_03655 [Mycobacteriales bacterium]